MPNFNTSYDSKLENLCSHYKDSCNINFASVRQRDIWFYSAILVLIIFVMQIISIDVTLDTFGKVIEKYSNIEIENYINLFSTLTWFFLFMSIFKYYRLNSNIEKQYSYILVIENLLNTFYPNTMAFTREGKSYLSNYPKLLNYCHFIYTKIFPLLVLIGILVKYIYELTTYKITGYYLIPNGFFFLSILLATILYILDLSNINKVESKNTASKQQ